MWNCTHFRHPTDEQLPHVIYFLATTIICSLSTLKIWVVMHHQYGISALVSKTLFCGNKWWCWKSLLFSHVNDTLTDCRTTMLFNKSNCCYFLFFKYWQGCALAEPGGPWHSTFALGRLENCSFFIQIICWHPRFNSFRTLGSLQFSFEHSLDYWLHGLCFGKIFIVLTN